MQYGSYYTLILARGDAVDADCCGLLGSPVLYYHAINACGAKFLHSTCNVFDKWIRDCLCLSIAKGISVIFYGGTVRP